MLNPSVKSLNPDYIVTYDALPEAVVGFFHEDAVYSIRIRRIGSLSGAQVVVDANNDIIQPSAPGVGSDDLVSPQNFPLIVLHLFGDVAPTLVGMGSNTISSLIE